MKLTTEAMRSKFPGQINPQPEPAISEPQQLSPTNAAPFHWSSCSQGAHAPEERMSLDRRKFLSACGSLGFGATLLPGVLFTIAAKAEDKRITADMIDDAAIIAGVPVAPDQKEAMLSILNTNRKGFVELRTLELRNDIPPAFIFDPMPPGQEPTPPPPGADLRKPLHITAAPAIASKDVPKDLNEIAFATVRELGELVRCKKVSSLDLTEMYIARLKKYNQQLYLVITLTEERALAQAREADKEIACEAND